MSSLEAFVSGRSVVTASGAFAPGDPRRSVDNGSHTGGGTRLDWSTRASSHNSDDSEKNIVLAERTSQLMSSYRDYIVRSGGGDEEMDLDQLYGEAATKDYSSPPNSPRRRSDRPFDETRRGSDPPAAVFRPNSPAFAAAAAHAAPLLREWNAPANAVDPNDELWDERSTSSWEKKYRYAHPVYRTRQFKRAFLSVVAIAAIVGTSIGIAKGVKRERLPDWDEELKEALVEGKAEKENGTGEWELLVGKNEAAERDAERPPAVEEDEKPYSKPSPSTNNAEMKDIVESEFGIAELSGAHVEALTRHVLCCSSTMVDMTGHASANNGGAYHPAQLKRAERHRPVWYDRSNGWDGSTYAEALEFCSGVGEDTQLCPYEAYCPAGPHHVPLGGYRTGECEGASSRSPIADHPNGWVQVGERNGCVQYTIVDPGNAASDDVEKEEAKASDGAAGQAHLEKDAKETEDAGAAAAIASDVQAEASDQTSAPAVKPGPSAMTEELLSKHQQAAKDRDELHRPSATNAESTPAAPKPDAAPAHGPQPDPQSAVPHRAPLAPHAPASHTAVGTSAANLDMAAVLHQKFKPLWLSAKEGWTGGSHDDAAAFCASVRGKRLCPYSAMCPHGVGGSVMGGRHRLEFDVEGEQYAPVLGGGNHWVLIGKVGDTGVGDGSGAERRCMTHRQLEGREPEWGLSSERAELKQHIMCCTVN